MIPLIFILGTLLAGGALCVSYLRRGIAADIGPQLKRVLNQLDNIESAINLALVTRYAELNGQRRPGRRLALRIEAQLRTNTGELDAPTQSWADVGASAQRYHTNPPACHDHRDVVDMPHRTTCTNCHKIGGFLRKLKSHLLARVTLRVFAAPDADARRHGWQITVTNDGRGRITGTRASTASVFARHAKAAAATPGTLSAPHATGQVALSWT